VYREFFVLLKKIIQTFFNSFFEEEREVPVDIIVLPFNVPFLLKL